MVHTPVILIAEDDDNDVFMLQRALKKTGGRYAVRCVRDGQQVMEYLAGTGTYENRAEYPLPFILLLDIKMPRMNGFEALRWIRSQPGLRHLPVIMVTASDWIRDLQQAHELGASSFVWKNRSLAEFQDAIAALPDRWIARAPMEKACDGKPENN